MTDQPDQQARTPSFLSDINHFAYLIEDDYEEHGCGYIRATDQFCAELDETMNRAQTFAELKADLTFLLENRKAFLVEAKKLCP